MCQISNRKDRFDIEEAIAWFVTRRKQFTGYEVWQRWTETFRKGLPYEYSAQQVSSWVREMFNQHYDVFMGYGCYPIENGPLLFFPVPAYVKGKSKKIQQTMKVVVKQEEQIALGG